MTDRSLFSIAGVQQSLSALRENVTAMEARIGVLMDIYPWVQMVMFSELAPLGPLTVNAQPFPNRIEDRFRAVAQKHGIWLIPGSMFERAGDRIYNTASVINPHGEVVGRYRKMFPFYPYEEGVDSGDSFLVFDVPEVGRFGLSICYDMWFPETSRTLAAMGAEVILHPTLTSSIDRDVELAMARATAAQNQCFFFDVNGIGDGGIGRSIVIGPHGDILHRCGSGPEMFPLEIDLFRVRRSREVGLKGLGQPLKSFRDCAVDFPVYDRAWRADSTLAKLGPLQKARRSPVVKPPAAAAEAAPIAPPHAPAAIPVHSPNLGVAHYPGALAAPSGALHPPLFSGAPPAVGPPPASPVAIPSPVVPHRPSKKKPHA